MEESLAFCLSDIPDTKLLTKLRLEFSELREHKFRHNFNCIDPMCLCGHGVEDNEHFLLHCQRFSIHRTSYLDNVSHLIKRSTATLSDSSLCNILLFSGNQLNDITNKLILGFRVPPQKFPEHSRENNSILFSNKSLLLKIPLPMSQPPEENPGVYCGLL